MSRYIYISEEYYGPEGVLHFTNHLQVRKVGALAPRRFCPRKMPEEMRNGYFS
jgi:hypothetical protein